MAKKPVTKKKSSTDILTEEEIVHEAERQGDLSHEEAEQILEEDSKLEAGVQPVAATDNESDVKRPEVQGHRKTKFEQPGTNNIKREVIEE